MWNDFSWAVFNNRIDSLNDNLKTGRRPIFPPEAAAYVVKLACELSDNVGCSILQWFWEDLVRQLIIKPSVPNGILRWRAKLQTSNKYVTPVLSDISISYWGQNVIHLNKIKKNYDCASKIIFFDALLNIESY